MKFSGLAAAAAAAVLTVHPAQALEKVRVATTSLGLWDTSQPAFCQERGEFAKAGLDVEVSSTRGGSENVQAVVAGGLDIGFSPGIDAVIAAYAHGHKLKIVSSEGIGQDENFFYVPAASPIKTMADLNGKTVAFSRPGGATEAVLLDFKNEHKLDIKPKATGAMDATFTMVMTGQIDVGYAFPPSMLDQVAAGNIRVLFTGADVAKLKEVSGRVIIARGDYLKEHRDTVRKFLEVLDRCIDWSYAHPKDAAAMYGKMNKVSADVAEKGIAFYPREALRFGPLLSLDYIMQRATNAKFIDKPLSDAQVKDLVDIVYTTPKS